jgi:hypothetical protein
MDISVAAARWMRYPRASYVVPQHAFTVKRAEGCSSYMRARASARCPAILKIASDRAHPEQELALGLLSQSATPESDAGFRSVDLAAQVQNAGAPGEIARQHLIMSRASRHVSDLLSGRPAKDFTPT